MKRNKMFLPVLLLIVSILVVSGCSGGNVNPSTDNAVAQEVADTFANMGNGFTQETNDDLAFFNDSGGVSANSLTSSEIHSSAVASYTVVLGGGVGSWNWDGTKYSHTINNLSVSVPPDITGSINPYYVTIMLDNGGVQVDGTGHIPNTVHSATYHREITGSLDNSLLHTHRTGTVTTDLVFTGLNDGSDGVTINGTRTATWTVNGAWNSNATINFTFTNLHTTYTLINGGYMAVYDSGTITVDYNGTITGPKGNTRNVHTTGTIQVNGVQRTVIITIDGNSVIVDITTGHIE